MKQFQVDYIKYLQQCAIAEVRMAEAVAALNEKYKGRITSFQDEAIIDYYRDRTDDPR